MAYQFDSRVRYSETGMDRKLKMVSLVDYFQDCSTFQSESLGCGLDYMEANNLAWMVLSWQIEIVRRPSLGEKITVQTWPYGFKAFYGYRNFAMTDERGEYAARANSVWVLMDLAVGKPCKVISEYTDKYVLEPQLEMETSSRKIKIPEESVVQEAFSVCQHHLDTNNHVNNGQYIRMAEDYLPAGFETGRLCVEYRQQARLHDVIIPKVHEEADLVVVSLCGEEDKVYSVVSFARSQAQEQVKTSFPRRNR